MANFLKSYWANRAELPPIDIKRFQLFLREELRYYNALVTAFAGPLRTMPKTFAETNALEPLLAVVAENSISLRDVDAKNLPSALVPFKAQLFDMTGKSLLDNHMLFLADVLASAATLDRKVRREMGMNILRECRRQSRLLNGDEHEMATIVEVLLPIETNAKRHIQVPRASVKIMSETKDTLVLKLPYFETEITVSKPTSSWNHIYVRLGPDGVVSVDLAFEENGYALRKIDKAPLPKTGRAPPLTSKLARQGR